MYGLWLTNHGQAMDGGFADIDSAVLAAKRIGFECAILDLQAHRMMAIWSPISGLDFVDEFGGYGNPQDRRLQLAIAEV